MCVAIVDRLQATKAREITVKFQLLCLLGLLCCVLKADSERGVGENKLAGVVLIHWHR